MGTAWEEGEIEYVWLNSHLEKQDLYLTIGGLLRTAYSSTLVCSVLCECHRKSDVSKFLWVGENWTLWGKWALSHSWENLEFGLRATKGMESLVRSGVEIQATGCLQWKGRVCLGMWVVPEVVPLHCSRKTCLWPPTGCTQPISTLCKAP